MKEFPASTNEPHPIGIKVFRRVDESLIIGVIIGAEVLKQELLIPSTDEWIDSSILPVGTPFNTIEVTRTQSNPPDKFKPGTRHTFISSMLFRVNEFGPSRTEKPQGE